MVKPPPLEVLKLRSRADLESLPRPSLYSGDSRSIRNPFLGFCYVCADLSSFDFEQRENLNFRETLKCRGCNLVNRTRAAIHLLEIQGGITTQAGKKIYLTEQSTDLFGVMKSRFPDFVGSEFLGDGIPLGEVNQAGIRNEDLTRLTFESESFDAVVCLEVLEHLPRFETALKEMWRVLKPGGVLLFSIPFWESKEKTVTRASVAQDGIITYHLPAEYHLDPNHSEGCLCYYDFGWDILEKAASAGFNNAHALYYHSIHYGYLGHDRSSGSKPIQFWAEKPAH